MKVGHELGLAKSTASDAPMRFSNILQRENQLVWVVHAEPEVKEDKLHELPHVAFLTNKYGEAKQK